MEVILLERVANLGAIGDVVKVRDGFGRNYLIPRKKAQRATAENKRMFEERRHVIEAQNQQARAQAEQKAKSLEGITVTLVRQASEDGRLYGSVTSRDIAAQMEEMRLGVDRKQVSLAAVIKQTGVYTAQAHLHAEVVVPIKVQVARTESDAQATAPQEESSQDTNA